MVASDYSRTDASDILRIAAAHKIAASARSTALKATRGDAAANYEQLRQLVASDGAERTASGGAERRYVLQVEDCEVYVTSFTKHAGGIKLDDGRPQSHIPNDCGGPRQKGGGQTARYQYFFV